jgi:NTP pyrophosphatase (non-canonical NTP hydrolase)
MKTLIVNAIQCKNCKDILFSRAGHDWRSCSCYKNEENNLGCYIDGGFDPHYGIGGSPDSLVLELTNISKGVLYADWNKRVNKHGLYKQGKLPKNIKIKNCIGIDLAKEGSDKTIKIIGSSANGTNMYLQHVCIKYPECLGGWPCPKHDPEEFKKMYNTPFIYPPGFSSYYFDNTLERLRKANLERWKEWYGDRDVPGSYFGNEMAGEAGEACNVIKKLDREMMGMVGSRATKEQLEEELADVLICIDLIAIRFGIDLTGDIIKNKFNKTSEKYGLKTKMD